MIDCFITTQVLELEARRLLEHAGVGDVRTLSITPTIDSGDAVLSIQTDSKIAWVTLHVPDMEMSLSDWSERYLRPGVCHIAKELA